MVHEVAAADLCSAHVVKSQDALVALNPLARAAQNFYEEHSAVAARTQEEVDQYRRDKKITVEGKKVPKPVPTWTEAKLPPYVMPLIMDKHWQTPTPVQSQAIPMAYGGDDLIAISETGSGKTLAYLLPAIVHICAQDPTTPQEGPSASHANSALTHATSTDLSARRSRARPGSDARARDADPLDGQRHQRGIAEVGT